MATVYLSLMGKAGVREVAVQNLSKAEYAKQAIAAVDGFSLPLAGPTFNEFVVEAEEEVAAVLDRLEQRGILGGIALGGYFGEMKRCFLVCVTEQNSRAEIDALAAALAGGER